MPDIATVTAPLIPVRDLATYTGSYDDSVRILVTVDNLTTNMMPYSALANAFVATASVPAGVGVAGQEGQLAISPEAVYTYTNGAWGASPRYKSNWSDLTDTTRFLLVDRSTQGLSTAEQANGRANLGITVASATTAGLAKAGDGLTAASDGTLSVNQATPTQAGSVFIDATDEDNQSRSAVSLTFLNSQLDSLREYVDGRQIPIASTTQVGGISASNTVHISPEGVATVPDATTASLGVVYLSNGDRSDGTGVVTGAQAAAIATTIVGELVPPASDTQLGAVRVGDGLHVTAQGLLSVKAATPRTDITSTDGSYGSVLPTSSITGNNDANSETMVPTVNAVRNYVHDQLAGEGDDITIFPSMLPVAGTTPTARGAVYGSSTVSVSTDGEMSVHIANGREYPLRPGLLKAASVPGQAGAGDHETAVTPAYLSVWKGTALADSSATGFVKTSTVAEDNTPEKKATVPSVNKVSSMLAGVQTNIDSLQAYVTTLVGYSQDAALVPTMSTAQRGVAKLWSQGALPDDDTVERVPLSVTNGMLYILKSDITGTSDSGSSSDFDDFKEVVTSGNAYLSVKEGATLALGGGMIYFDNPASMVTTDSSGIRHYDGAVLDSYRLALGNVGYTDSLGNQSYAEVVVGDDSVSGRDDTAFPFIVRTINHGESDATLDQKLQTVIAPDTVAITLGNGTGYPSIRAHVDSAGLPAITLNSAEGEQGYFTSSSFTVSSPLGEATYAFPANPETDVLTDTNTVLTAATMPIVGRQHFFPLDASSVMITYGNRYVQLKADGDSPMIKMYVEGSDSLAVYPTRIRAANGGVYGDYIFGYNKSSIVSDADPAATYANNVVTVAMLKTIGKKYFYTTGGGSSDQGQDSSQWIVITDATIAIGANASSSAASPAASWTVALGSSASALYDHCTAVGARSRASHYHCTAVGGHATATARMAVAVGSEAHANSSHATAVGRKAIANALRATALGCCASAISDCTALGCHATASGSYSTAVGKHATAAGFASTALGHLSAAEAYGATSLGQGTNASGQCSLAVGFWTKATSDYATAVGYRATARGNHDTAVGNNATASGFATALGFHAAASSYSTAVGCNATASGSYATALGCNAAVSGDNAIAIGLYASSAGDNATALGCGSSASGDYATAIGDGAEAGGSSSIALGSEASASGTHATAIGRNAKATATRAIQLGEGTNNTGDTFQVWDYTLLNRTTGKIPAARLPDGIGGGGSIANIELTDNKTVVGVQALAISDSSSTAIGSTARVLGQNSTAVGSEAEACSYATALGNATKALNFSLAAGTSALANGDDGYSTALGYNAAASSYSTGVGGNAKAQSTAATAVGSQSEAADSAAALGYSAAATGRYASAVGRHSTASAEHAIAFGCYANATALAAIQLGAGSNDTANTFQVGSYRLLDANGVIPLDRLPASVGGTGGGGSIANIELTDNKTVVGVKANASGSSSTAVGIGASAKGHSTALGADASASGTHATAIGKMAGSRDYATAVGTSASADGDYAIAIGCEANASGGHATAVGSNASASTYAIALGDMATASTYAIALGIGASASSYATALGIGAAASSYGTALGRSALASTLAIALGIHATASDTYAIALGNGAKATAQKAIQLGNGTNTTANTFQVYDYQLLDAAGKIPSDRLPDGIGGGGGGGSIEGIELTSEKTVVGVGASARDYATALGTRAKAGDNSTAVGYGASASDDHALALGNMAIANVVYAAALGYHSTASTYAIAVGTYASADTHATAVGCSAEASSFAIALGYEAKASTYATALGCRAKASSYAIVIGPHATSREHAVVLGLRATASDGHATAVGNMAKASYHATALGCGATASYHATALGCGATANGDYAIAIGYDAKSSSYATAVGTSASASGSSSTALGYDANSSSYATTVGCNAKSNNYATAVGCEAKAISGYAAALGYKASASYYATALGYDATAGGSSSTAVGSQTQASDGATALGAGASASNKATALGFHATAGGGATAIGFGCRAVINHSTAMRVGNDRALHFWIDSSGNVWLGTALYDGETKYKKINLTSALSSAWEDWT